MGGAYNEHIFEKQTWQELKIAYSAFVDHVAWMEGHGGYTGSFAEKGEVIKIDGEWDKDDAYNHCVDYNDKWGPSYAYLLLDGRWYVGGWCSS